MTTEAILQPAVVAAIVSAIVGPLIFFLLKRWDDKKRRNFEIRYEEYKHYLKALEQIASSSHTDFERLMSETYTSCINEILTTEGQSSNPLVRLNQEVNNLTADVRKSFTQATEELHGLRLVCSKELLQKVNEYVNIQRELIDSSCYVMGNLDQMDINNPSASLSGEMKEKGERTRALFEEIVQQMRKELGIK
ncbi:hypothetical protein [Idiomarina sp.]|uniref:hypothetical protein n=1 Tax=Idiomarina sp. TaxID=1874361 RepID=UPI00258AF8A3|nr:hypothetical protein [Idiomarina sp.]